MARVSYPDKQHYPEEYLNNYEQMLKERGDPAPNVFLALANMPNLLGLLLAFTKEMKQGAKVDQHLRELAIVSVGIATGSDYEVAHHRKIAVAAGVPIEKLDQLKDFDSAKTYDDRERAVIEYAREATVNLKVSDRTWQTLSVVLPERERMDIVITVAWYNAVARILLPLEIELEDWFRAV